MARMNLGIVALATCLLSILFGVISNACPDSKDSKTFAAKLCRGLSGWGGCITSTACCIALIVGLFRSLFRNSI